MAAFKEHTKTRGGTHDYPTINVGVFFQVLPHGIDANNEWAFNTFVSYNTQYNRITFCPQSSV